MTDHKKNVLLTGATGYIGSRLLKRLENRSVGLRCLARRPEALSGRVGPGTEVVRGDLLDPESMAQAMQGMDAVYYLVHSMQSPGDFKQLEVDSAENFVTAARASGIKRIVYLGGLAHGQNLSPHLQSRQDVGAILRESGIPTIEFRASIVIGAGSLSFDMVKTLVTRLPVMTTPKWVTHLAQPIYIDDVMDYLVSALDVDLDGNLIVEIGGADQVSYLDIMKELARLMGLKRIMIPVPVLTPRLSSLWLALVTPLHAKVGMKLIEGVRNDSIVRDTAALALFDVQPLGIRQALTLALAA